MSRYFLFLLITWGVSVGNAAQPWREFAPVYVTWKADTITTNMGALQNLYQTNRSPADLKFADDLRDLAGLLMVPDDPKVILEIGTNYASSQVTSSITPAGDMKIEFEPGIFALTGNLSELAAVFSLELSKLKPVYEKALVQLIETLAVPAEATDKLAYLKERLTQATKDPATPHDTLNKLKAAIKISEQIGKFEARNKKSDLQQLLSQTNFKIPVSKNAETEARSAIEAVDRLWKAGFNPWSIYTPKKHQNELARWGGKRIGILPKTWRYLRGNVPQDSGGSLQLSLIESYLLYLESKKIDLTQLEYRNQGLTPEQQKVHRQALVARFIKFGPELQDLTYFTAAVGALFAVAHSGKPALEWAGDTISRFFQSDTKPAETAPVPTGPGFFSRVLNTIGDFTESAWNSTFGRLPPVRDWVPDSLHGFFADAYKDSVDFVAPLVGKAAELGLDGAKVLGPAYGLYLAERLLLGKPRLWGNHFFRRLVLNLGAQMEQFKDLLRSWALGSTTADIESLVANQGLVSEFIRDGRTPHLGKIMNRTLYQLLFGSGRAYHLLNEDRRLDVFKKFRDDVETAVRANLEEQFKNDTGETANAVSKRAIHQLAQKITAPDMWEKANFPLEQFGEYAVSKLKDRAENSAGIQRMLFATLGGLNGLFNLVNNRLLLSNIEARLSAPDVSKEEKETLKQAILKLNLDIDSPATQARQLSLLTKYFPDYPLSKVHFSSDLQTLWEEKERPPQYLLSAKARAMEQKENLSPVEAMRLFAVQMDHDRHREALRTLQRHFSAIIQEIHSGRSEPDYRWRARNAISTLFSQFGSMDSPFWIRSYLKKDLFLRALALKDPNVRLAFGTRLLDANLNRGGPLDFLSQPVIRTIITGNLREITNASDLIDTLTKLRDEYDMEPRFAAEFLAEHLEAHPEILRTEADIQKVLTSETPWHKLGTELRNVEDSEWETGLYDRYRELAKKYQSYNYNPGHSARLHSVLIQRFEALKPQATQAEKIEFWKSLADKGPGGLSDAYIEKILPNLTPEQMNKFAADSLSKGQIWDPEVRAQLYRATVGKKLNPRFLDRASRRAYQNLKIAIEKARAAPSSQREMRVLGTALRGRRFQFESPADEARLLRKVRRLALNPRIDIEKTLAPEKSKLYWAGRLSALDNEIEELRGVFPETGHAFVNLLDWVSQRTRTRQHEAFHIRDQFMNGMSGEKDLAASVIQEIVEEASKWEKVEQWKLIRWLRGTGPVPDEVAKKTQRMGAETMRRLYTTLPIFVRRGFISTLLTNSQNSLLSGPSQKIYYEQVMNEILPQEKANAEMAQEIVNAFLKAFRDVSHKNKQDSVLAYLLANNASNASIGYVLKNILEEYGVPGIKFGQLLAASDLLPEDIRQILSQLREKAKEPMRHEIFERLIAVLKRDKLEKHFIVEDLKGAASVKYAITVLRVDGDQIEVADPQGRRHVIQVKREEAEVAIPRTFEELKMIITDLIQRKPARYAFMRGMIEATKDDTWQELNLVREGHKAAMADEEYAKLDFDPDVKLDISQTTPLIAELGGPEERFYILRSSEYSEGKNISEASAKLQKRMASNLLNGEKQLLFPDDDRDTRPDKDRHPGNVIWDYDKETIYYRPIDWGQQYLLTSEDRNRVTRLMAYAQILEHVGAQKSLVDQLLKEFDLTEDKIGKAGAQQLRRSIAAFFPNTAGKPRSSLIPYYYLLSEMETAGFKRNNVNFGLIKGIYQLEYYEDILRDETHASPRAELAKRVEAQVRSIAASVTPTLLEKIRYGLSHPQAALVVRRNTRLVNEGKLEVDSLLAGVGLSQGARNALLKAVPPSVDLKRPADVTNWLRETLVLDRNAISAGDSRLLSAWLDHPRLSELALDHLSIREVSQLMNTSTIAREINPSQKVARRSLPQPYAHSVGGGIAKLFSAEILNSVFWTLWDRDPIRAYSWAAMTVRQSPFSGLLSFVTIKPTLENLANRLLPMSWKKTRGALGVVLPVGAGMIAADLVSRAFSGQSLGELSHALSGVHGATLGVKIAAFSAVQQSTQNAFKYAEAKGWVDGKGCGSLLAKFAPALAAVAGATAAGRAVQQYYSQDENGELIPNQSLLPLAQTAYPRIDAALAKVEALAAEGKNVEAYLALTGGTTEELKGRLFGATVNALGVQVPSVRYSSENDSVMGEINRYKNALEKQEREMTDTYSIALAEEESRMMGNISRKFDESLRPKFFFWSELKPYGITNPESLGKSKPLWGSEE